MSAPVRLACSGLMYAGVPTIPAEAMVVERYESVSGSPTALATPEVDHLRHRPAVESRQTSTFDGLMSR